MLLLIYFISASTVCSKRGHLLAGGRDQARVQLVVTVITSVLFTIRWPEE